MSRALVAGVGYRNLRDHSVGVVVTDQLAVFPWGPGVSVEDLSFNPIAVVQRLEDDALESRFDRAIFVSAVPRGRNPGTVTVYRWDGVLPPDEDIHQAVCDAVTGVIHLDNTLVVARHFKELPDDTVVIEVEPMAHEHGDTFSLVVDAAASRVRDLIAAAIEDPAVFADLPCTPLGGANLPPPLPISRRI